MDQITLGIEDTIEKMNISVKENVKPKRGPKKYRKFGILKKGKPKNNRNTGRKRKGPGNVFNKSIEERFFLPKEEDAYKV